MTHALVRDAGRRTAEVSQLPDCKALGVAQKKSMLLWLRKVCSVSRRKMPGKTRLWIAAKVSKPRG